MFLRQAPSFHRELSAWLGIPSVTQPSVYSYAERHGRIKTIVEQQKLFEKTALREAMPTVVKGLLGSGLAVGGFHMLGLPEFASVILFGGFGIAGILSYLRYSICRDELYDLLNEQIFSDTDSLAEYSPFTKDIYLNDDQNSDTSWDESIVHELLHSYQDQLWQGGLTTQASEGHHLWVIEGMAVAVSIHYLLTRDDADSRQRAVKLFKQSFGDIFGLAFFMKFSRMDTSELHRRIVRYKGATILLNLALAQGPRFYAQILEGNFSTLERECELLLA